MSVVVVVVVVVVVTVVVVVVVVLVNAFWRDEHNQIQYKQCQGNGRRKAFARH